MNDITIKKFLNRGELPDDADSVDDILDCAGRAIDESHVTGSLGKILFADDRGDLYAVTIEAVVQKLNPSIVQDIIEDPCCAEDWVNTEDPELADALGYLRSEIVALMQEYIERETNDR